MILFNPLRLRDRLAERGMDQGQAEALAEVLCEPDMVEVATKSDLTELRADIQRISTEMRAEFARVEARLMRWMIAGAALGGLVGGFIGSMAR